MRSAVIQQTGAEVLATSWVTIYMHSDPFSYTYFYMFTNVRLAENSMAKSQHFLSPPCLRQHFLSSPCFRQHFLSPPCFRQHFLSPPCFRQHFRSGICYESWSISACHAEVTLTWMTALHNLITNNLNIITAERSII
jgi:hypothetical protein